MNPSGSGLESQQPVAPQQHTQAVVESPTSRREQRRMARLSGDGQNSPSKNSQMRSTRDSAARSSPVMGVEPSFAPSPQQQSDDMGRYGLAGGSEPPSPSEGQRSPTFSRTARRRMGSVPARPSETGASETKSSMQRAGTSRHARAQALRASSGGNSMSERSGRMHRHGTKDDDEHRHHQRLPGHAELFIIGEIEGASRFQRSALYCRWQLVYEPTKSWVVHRGLEQGATQVASSAVSEDSFVAWEHPLDMQLTTQTVQGWPSLLFMVYARDDVSSKDQFVSYGICAVPCTPGIHHISCQTWFAVEAHQEQGRRLFELFTGATPRLEDESFVTDVQKRDDAGPFVASIGAGQVHLRLQILMKNANNLSHLSGESLYRSLEKIQHSLLLKSRQEMNKLAAMQELRPEESEGLKIIREGRDKRFDMARQSLEQRHSRDPSPSVGARDGSRAPSADGRSRSVDARAPRGSETNVSGQPEGGADPGGRGGSRSVPRQRGSRMEPGAGGVGGVGDRGDQAAAASGRIPPEGERDRSADGSRPEGQDRGREPSRQDGRGTAGAGTSAAAATAPPEERRSVRRELSLERGGGSDVSDAGGAVSEEDMARRRAERAAKRAAADRQSGRR